jgi:serine/threonine-protein kinase
VEPVPFDLDYYQAPEQRENPGAASPRTDLYAVGAILYQMLTGEVPLADALPPSRVHREVPRTLDPVVMRALAEDPEARFDSATAMKQTLEAALRPRLSPVLWVGLALVLLAAAGVGGYLLVF